MHTRVRTIFFLIFALSGFSGLIYESIWTHYLKLFLGHAAYAQTLVLAIFMGGLALGSWVCSIYSIRWKNLLIGYAITEGVIGLLALVFHDVFNQLVQLSYTGIIPSLVSPMAVNAFKWTLSATLILPQTILLGMTFPLMSAGILRTFPQNPGKSLSMLYFTNSIGAAAGVLVSGFMLIRIVGLPGTIRIAGIINLALAIFVYLLIRKEQGGLPASGAVNQGYEPYGTYKGTDKRPAHTWYCFMLAASLVTGTASFIYEIGWIRMLSLVLGSSTHAFELMLAAFIFGLAFGGLWIQRRIDSLTNPIRSLMLVQVVMGFLALSTLLLYGNTFKIMQWLLKTLEQTDTGYALFNLSSHAIALAIMLPSTFCAGMTLPLITYILIREGHGEKSIGAVYGANTIGAIIGVFFAVHFGMPNLGLKGLITFGGSMDIALGLALLWSTAARYNSNRRVVLLTAVCVSIIMAAMLFVKLDPYKMASGVYRDGDLKTPENTRLIYHKDGKTATVSVIGDILGTEMNIRTNGKTDASIAINPQVETIDESTMVLLAVIPMALNPQAETAAVIGWGSGLTTHTLLYNRMLKQVDTVEIERAMVEAAKNFGDRVWLAYNDQRSRIHIDDAKTFFSVQNRKYDIITSEPSNPWVSGVAGLFSQEFYRLISRHLSADGIFCQWIQLYEIDVPLVMSVLKAVSANFPDFVIYAANDADLLVIAKKDGMLADIDANFLKTPEVAHALKRIHIESMQDIELHRIGNKKVLGKLIETFQGYANSDYYPILDQNAERSRFLKQNATELLSFTREPLPTLEMLMGTGPSAEGTDITFSPSFALTQNVRVSMFLRDYLLHGSFSAGRWNPVDTIRQQAVQFRRLFYECGAALGEQERMGTLYNTAAVMTSFLKPDELGAIWRVLESGPCARSLSPEEKNWVSLFKAVGKRDARAMVSVARTLLETESNIPPGALRYLVASAMLGSLAQGDRDEAARIWRDYHVKIYGTNKPGLLFRLLVANSSFR